MKAVSCTTSHTLGLIKPHDRLDHLLPESNVISSSAYKLMDESQLKVHMLVRKPTLNTNNEKAPIVCLIQEQSSTICSNKQQFYDGCSKKEQVFTKCPKNKQVKNSQADKSAQMWTVKPAMNSVHMQSNRPAVPIQEKMSMQKIVPQGDDKNCQSTKCYKKVDKNCQTTNMQPVKPAMDIQSVTNTSYKRLCSDKNCQSTRCYKKKDQVKSVCSDKNCQETNFYHMGPLKPEMKKKSSVMWLPKPEMEHSTYKLNQDSKNYQSDRCFSFMKKDPARPVWNDKNCQSATIM